MKILYYKSFEKDLSKIKDPKLSLAVELAIKQIKLANRLSELINVKKMKGHKLAYRIRIGDYRIGFLFENNIVSLSAIGDRKDFYKSFP
jgi:mRNA interferase RelE/StbE